MNIKSRSSRRQLAFWAGITLTFLSAQLLAQETTGGDHHFDDSQVGVFRGESFRLAVASLGDINIDGILDIAAGPIDDDGISDFAVGSLPMRESVQAILDVQP
ncbi:MAG: hypothetical protein QM477_06460 [Planctomycetota bacterium]